MTAPPARRRRSRRGAYLALALAVVLILVVIVVALRAVTGVFSGSGSHCASGGSGAVQVHVEPGDTETQIGERLCQVGVINSVSDFTSAASSQSAQIQPGYYSLHRDLSGSAAVSALLDPTSLVQQTVVIPEGLTAAGVVQRLVSDTTITQREAQAALHDPSAIGLPAWAHGHVEGLLYPATYDFAPGTTAVQAVGQMVARFEQEAQTLHLASAARKVGISEYDAVILASILEHEYKLPADLPKIAEVFLNRYHNHMPLGSNATLAYVLGHAPATQSELHLASPYNTEFNPGFPPTPIGSPGEQTLNAVLHPAHGDLLYFVIVDQQGHAAFASDEAGYQQIAAEAHANGLH